jgi:hypothetical protein
MNYGKRDQRTAMTDWGRGPALLDPSLVRSIVRTWGAAVLHPYEQETARLLRRRMARNLVFVEATVALPVGVES